MHLEIEKKYKIKGNTTGKHDVNGFGVLDFDKLTLEEADALFKAGCPIFEKKDKAESSVAKTDDAKK
jgi:hypothetical protein